MLNAIRRYNVHSIPVAAVVLALCVFPSTVWSGYTYQLFDVPGATQTTIYDINNAGALVGLYSTGAGYSGYLYSGGSITTLLVPGSYASFPYGINERGDVVGQQLIDAPGGGNWWRPFVRYANGVYATLPALPVAGVTFMSGAGINDYGDVVGVFFATGDTDGAGDGYVYHDGTYRIIPNVWPEDIRSDGAMAGTLPSYFGAVFTSLADLAAFRVPNSSTQTTAYSINAYGDVAGTFFAPDEQGYIRHSDGSFEVVNVPNQTRTLALGLNDLGVIAGTYYDDHATYLRNRGFLATPDGPRPSVPEPTTLALLGAGLIVAVFSRRSRGKASY